MFTIARDLLYARGPTNGQKNNRDGRPVFGLMDTLGKYKRPMRFGCWWAQDEKAGCRQAGIPPTGVITFTVTIIVLDRFPKSCTRNEYLSWSICVDVPVGWFTSFREKNDKGNRVFCGSFEGFVLHWLTAAMMTFFSNVRWTGTIIYGCYKFHNLTGEGEWHVSICSLLLRLIAADFWSFFSIN